MVSKKEKKKSKVSSYELQEDKVEINFENIKIQ